MHSLLVELHEHEHYISEGITLLGGDRAQVTVQGCWWTAWAASRQLAPVAAPQPQQAHQQQATGSAHHTRGAAQSWISITRALNATLTKALLFSAAPPHPWHHMQRSHDAQWFPLTSIRATALKGCAPPSLVHSPAFGGSCWAPHWHRLEERVQTGTPQHIKCINSVALAACTAAAMLTSALTAAAVPIPAAAVPTSAAAVRTSAAPLEASELDLAAASLARRVVLICHILTMRALPLANAACATKRALHDVHVGGWGWTC